MAEQPTPAADDSQDEQELQRSSHEFLGELERLEGMERRKRAMAPRDDQRVPLAREIEDATIGLVGMSRYQTRLIEMAHQAAGGDGKPRRKPAEILGEWRTAERDLRDARGVMERAMDAADGLRQEHRRSLRSRLE
jgi:hypothetical protein